MTTINPSNVAQLTPQACIEEAIENLAEGKLEALGNPADWDAEQIAEHLKNAADRLLGVAGDGGEAEATSKGFETVEEAMELFETDEKAFFEKLQEVRTEDRGAWLMAIQTKLQATNQLVTSITNFQKAQHDTQKAVLANIRV